MGILYDRKHDGGNGQVKKTIIPLDGSKLHVTQFNKSKNTRVSWDANGKSKNSASNQHRTDQNVKKGRSVRH